MATIARNPERHTGRTVGSGHCVAFVREVTGLPATAHWRADNGSVLDAAPGSAIATFDPDGRYGNHTDGRSHAAILVEATAYGLQVWDQWVGRTRPGPGVQQRLIRFNGGDGLPCDDGDAYSVIEVAA
jgi:hypothetical protein